METEIPTHRGRPRLLSVPLCKTLALTRGEQNSLCNLGSVRSGGETSWSLSSLRQGKRFDGEIHLLGESCDQQPFLQKLVPPSALLCSAGRDVILRTVYSTCTWIENPLWGKKPKKTQQPNQNQPCTYFMCRMALCCFHCFGR